jgi:hypothetical protein
MAHNDRGEFVAQVVIAQVHFNYRFAYQWPWIWVSA